jgi:hypothetical protein
LDWQLVEWLFTLAISIINGFQKSKGFSGLHLDAIQSGDK